MEERSTVSRSGIGSCDKRELNNFTLLAIIGSDCRCRLPYGYDLVYANELAAYNWPKGADFLARWRGGNGKRGHALSIRLLWALTVGCWLCAASRESSNWQTITFNAALFPGTLWSIGIRSAFWLSSCERRQTPQFW